MDQTETALGTRKAKGKDDVQGGDEDLVVIREQTRETVALLRQLIALLLPKGDSDQPKLEDLIAALVGQQATTIMLCQQNSRDLGSVLERLQIVVDSLLSPNGGPSGYQSTN